MKVVCASAKEEEGQVTGSQGSAGSDDILEQLMSLAGDYRYCVHKRNSRIAETLLTEVKATHGPMFLRVCSFWLFKTNICVVIHKQKTHCKQDILQETQKNHAFPVSDEPPRSTGRKGRRC